MALPSTGTIDDTPGTGYHGDLLGGVYDVRGGFVKTVALGAGALALHDSYGPNGELNIKGLADGDVVRADNVAGFVLRNETFAAADYGLLRQVELARKGRIRATAAAAVAARAQVYVGVATANLGELFGAAGANRMPVPGARWDDAVAEDALGVIEFDFGPIAAGQGLGTLPAFAAGTLSVPSNPPNGAKYDVPTTAANSTIVLPASASPGTTVEFSADGVKNGHTVQYVDATGSTNITTALTASKRHRVEATFIDGTWRASAYIGP